MHEFSHCVAALKTRHAEIDWACVRLDASGKVQFAHLPSNDLDNWWVSLAGWAGTTLFNVYECDISQNLKDARLHGSFEFARMRRDEVIKDLVEHRGFLKAGAELLYFAAPERVSGATIRRGWERYRAGASCRNYKELFG